MYNELKNQLPSIQKSVTNPPHLILLSTTGEIQDGLPEFHETDIEFPDCLYSGYYLINPIEIPQILNKMLTKITEELEPNNYLGDDTYYDYLPDYIDMALALATHLKLYTPIATYIKKLADNWEKEHAKDPEDWELGNFNSDYVKTLLG